LIPPPPAVFNTKASRTQKNKCWEKGDLGAEVSLGSISCLSHNCPPWPRGKIDDVIFFPDFKGGDFERGIEGIRTGKEEHFDFYLKKDERRGMIVIVS